MPVRKFWIRRRYGTRVKFVNFQDIQPEQIKTIRAETQFGEKKHRFVDFYEIGVYFPGLLFRSKTDTISWIEN